MSHDRRLIVFSGAGLSADSGLSTFRGADGLWESHRIDVVCNGYSWRQNRDLVHRFYNARRASLGSAEPNAMHRLLGDWQMRYGAHLIIQNVDDLLERAGAQDVLHVHGRLTSMRCVACGHGWDVGHAPWDAEEGRCPRCGSRKGVRPDVVFFNETAPLYRPMWKALRSLEPDDVLVVIGTDGTVIPIGCVAEGLRCRKGLNTLGPVAPGDWKPGMVRPEDFDRVLFRPAAEAAGELDAAVTNWMAARSGRASQKLSLT